MFHQALNGMVKYGMNFPENIKKARKAARLSQTELALACGWIESPQARISNYENGRREPSLNDLNKIALATGTQITELIQEGNKFSQTQRKTVQKNIIRIPVISFVQAGEWNEVVDPFHAGQADEWRETTANVNEQSFALIVKGDSMHNPSGTPSIPEGSYAIVDPTAEATNGSIVVAKLNNTQEATIKKLVKDGPNRYLKPLNPAYPVITINSDCSIVGVVKKIEIDM